MATYTSNYGWTKPSGSDNVDISVLNNNLDDQDSTIHDAFLNMAPPFSESSTYAVDDIVLYETGLYKCHTAVVTPGSWTGSTNWQVYKLSEGGGGGTSDYPDLTNKPQINSVELSGNKTTSDLGINADNVMMSDGTTSVEDALDELALSQMNPLSHNGIYTGRNLGTISSASDWAAFREEYGIADKSYKGLYLGDYVKVNDGTYNTDWMVAGFNTETNKGSTNIPGECVSMIPRVGNGCGTSYMNSTDVTTGGYKDSYMNTTKLPDVATKLTTIFGTNLLTRDILVSKAVTNGYASDWNWISCKCSLLTSVQVYGSLSFENTGGTYYQGYNIGEGYEKLPVFNFIHPVQFARHYFWLRGVNSASNFCLVDGSGHVYSHGASSALGVRPLICLN